MKTPAEAFALAVYGELEPLGRKRPTEAPVI